MCRYVSTLIDLSDKEVVRPFYPGGDYENYDYPENAVVIDNPPFSIITKIVRFYHKKGIKFFLFSPHLTLMSAKIIGVAYIVTNTHITYQNGAVVNTDFITNLIDGVMCMTAPTLRKDIMDTQKKDIILPKYIYPRNVVSSASLGLIADYEVIIKDGVFVSALDRQREYKKAIFGSGLLVSDEVANVIESHKQARKSKQEHDDYVFWELSDREKQIIESLNTK